jgi:hypothetical protein
MAWPLNGGASLPRAEDVQLLALAICPVAEHVLEEAINGRRVIVEEIMSE